jgi:Raf kinase inhibitor-like YbhB/YbcL family protein
MTAHRFSLVVALGAVALGGLLACNQAATTQPPAVPGVGGAGGQTGPVGPIPPIPGANGWGMPTGGSPADTVGNGGASPSNPDAATSPDSGSLADGAITDGGGTDAASNDGSSGALTLTGDFTAMDTRLCFKSGQTKNTGSNQSPMLAWMGTPPAGTLSWALSLYDTGGKTTHWVIWNIPADTTMLPAMLPKGVMPAAPAPTGSMQRGATFAGGTTNPGYFGPGAPGAARRYEFQLWPLKVAKLTVGGTTSVDTLHSTTLPANAAGMGVILSVWGNQDASCQ